MFRKALTWPCAVLLALAACDQAPTTAPAVPAPSFAEVLTGTWGEHAGDPLPPVTSKFTAVAQNASVGIISNPSFEDGGTCAYTGWTLWEGGASTSPTRGTWGLATAGQTIPVGGVVFDHFDGINVAQSSPGLPHTYTATDGTCVALQLQTGPQSHRMYQDITMPSVATMIDWDMEYETHTLLQLGQQELAVTIRNPSTDAILAYLFRTVPGDPTVVSTMTTFSGDVSAFSGQTVRLSVDMIVNSFYFDAAFDNFRIPIIVVDIDIKPGSDPNSIQCKNEKEVITVAVLTTDEFDALTVDHTTVAFEGGSETHVDKKTGEPRRHMEDVDLDGDMDLVFHFRLGDAGLTCGSDAGVLTGETYDGIRIEGTDVVRMIEGG